MTDRELMQMALDALINAKGYIFHNVLDDKANQYDTAVEALRARLAQPKPEPQETIDKWIKANTEHREWYICPKCSYQAPRFKDEWQGLTEDEIKSAWSELWYDLGNGKFAASDDPSRHTTVMFARAIEAKLKEKNT